MADPARRWPALDIVLRAAPKPPEPDVEGLLLAFLDDHAPTAITGPPGSEDGWLVTASPDREATPAWLAAPEPDAVRSATTPPQRAPRPHAWRVFFATPEARDAARAALAASDWAPRVDLANVDVEDDGWAQRSQASLRAIQVGRLIIAPPWDATTVAQRTVGADSSAAQRDVGADSSAVPRAIVIEPSMGFGTGHHQSTRLCLQALQGVDLAGRRILDLGTGSGVLAIAAAVLGADSVLALDDDRDAVDAARGNVRLNAVDTRVTVRQADLTSIDPYAADIVLANLTGALLVRHAASIARHVGRGGLLIVSGFTSDERVAVAHAFRDLQLLRDDREDGWVGLTLQSH